MNKFLSIFDYHGDTLKVVEKRKIWFSIPIAIMSISLIVFVIYAIIGGSFFSGFNLGIDFTGGTIVTVNLGREATGDKYDINAELIEEIIISKDMQVSYTQQSGTGADTAIVIRYTGKMSEKETAELNEEIKAEIEELYEDIYLQYQDDDAQFIEVEYIGATTSGSLIGMAALSISLAGIAILVYIVIRFEIFSGIAAIIALMHDVLIIIAFAIIARIQLNSEFIAVIITIIAYSINNTIVIFDRVRENMVITPISSKVSYSSIVNKSVSETLSRSVNTSITTLMTISALAILSVPIIRDFSLMIIVGLFAGTFSSVCIAPSIYCLFKEKMSDKDKDLKYLSNKSYGDKSKKQQSRMTNIKQAKRRA